MIATVLLWVTALSGIAHATIDPDCQDVADGGTPAGYSEQGQQDWLLNYFSLATTLSPMHPPVPVEPGHGTVGLELLIIPPVSCEHRLVLDYSKTEDTNKAPVAPRPRVIFSLPKVGPVVLYGGFAYVPPITVFGTRNVILSAEAGVGYPMENGLQLGLRYHATLMKTVAEIATPFNEGDSAKDDFYVGSTLGTDAMVGFETKKLTPYVALGFTDVSTFFYIGDDGYVGNNADPYLGFTGSVGTNLQLVKWLDLDGEFYTAPGYIYTGRVRAAVRF